MRSSRLTDAQRLIVRTLGLGQGETVWAGTVEGRADVTPLEEQRREGNREDGSNHHATMVLWKELVEAWGCYARCYGGGHVTRDRGRSRRVRMEGERG